MARKTFNKIGQSIVVDDGEAVSIGIIGELVANIDDTDGIVGNDDKQPAIVEPNTDPGNDTTTDSEVGPGANTTGFVDPSTTTVRTKRKYTRRNGGSERSTQNTAKTLVFATANLEKVLFNLHGMAAGLLAEPDLQIDKDEAKLLADAVTEVARAYDLSAVLSPKTQAVVDLSIALVTVYGQRAMKIVFKPKQRQSLTVMQSPIVGP